MNADIVPTLNHVIGQQRAVRVLRTALDAYFNDRAVNGAVDAFPHLLLTGPAGTGKTLLSEIVARELCTNLHTELAQNIKAPGKVHGLMLMLEPGDVLFLDELHELSPTTQVTLYRALEERMLFLGNSREAIELPPFTLIGATTDEHLLTRSMRDRFRILLRLTHYSDKETFQLVTQRAKRLGWAIHDDAVRAIAIRSRGTPRLAVRFLESSRRMASASAEEWITPEHVELMCEIEEIDALGLDAVEQRYLRLLRESEGPVRLNVLATHLGLPRRTIEHVFEPDLMRLGLVTKTDLGRILTPKGVSHLGTLGPETV